MTLYQPSNSGKGLTPGVTRSVVSCLATGPQLRWRQTTRTVSPPSSLTIVGVHAQVLTYSRRSGAVRSVVATLRRFSEVTTATRRDARSIQSSERVSATRVSTGVFHGLVLENGRASTT